MKRILILGAAAALFAGAGLAETIGSGMSDRTRWDGPAYGSIGVRAGDPAQCRDACRNDLKCYAWNYERPVGGDANSRCELLSQIPELVWDDNYISGTITRSQPAPDPDEVIEPRTGSGDPEPPPAPVPGEDSASLWSLFTMSEGMEASGAAYSSTTYKAKGDGGLTRCAKTCAASDKCEGFVVRSDAEIAPKPNVVCELKAAPGNLLRNPDATTGLRN